MKIIKFLFPSYFEKLENENNSLKIKIKELESKEFNLLDEIRIKTGLVPSTFSSTSRDGYPKHPLAELTQNERKSKIALLSMVYTNKPFMEMCNYLIDVQGSYGIKKSESYEQMLAARFSINGIARIVEELQSADSMYKESSHQDEEFDELDRSL